MRFRRGHDAVVNDAPDVAEEYVIARRQRGKLRGVVGGGDLSHGGQKRERGGGVKSAGDALLAGHDLGEPGKRRVAVDGVAARLRRARRKILLSRSQEKTLVGLAVMVARPLLRNYIFPRLSLRIDQVIST